MTLILFFLLLLIALLFFIYKFIIIPFGVYRRYQSKDLPGYFFPIMGYARFLSQEFQKKGDCFAFYKELAKELPHAKAHVSNFNDLILFELLDPKLIKEFYENSHCYEKQEFVPAMQSLVGTGLIQAKGNLWKQHRKLISTLFHFEFINQKIPLLVNTSREFLDVLARKPREDADIMDEIQKITGEMVGRIFFGENLNKYTMNGQPLTLYLSDLLVEIYKNQKDPIMMVLGMLGGKQSWSPSFRKVMQKVTELRQMCYRIVKDRRYSGVKSNDLLGLMLETQENPNKGEAFSDRAIVNEFMTFFVGGMDTTGHTVAMALYLLNNNPEYLETLKAEIKEVYDKEEIITHESINKMEFTHAIIKETLRMYSPVPGPLPRIAIKDHKLGDLDIKAGTDVRPNPIYSCFHPKYFNEPEKFKPERWLDQSLTIDPFVYIPFSAGNRSCIGQRLSILEMKIILAEFVKRFDFQVKEGYQLRMTANFLYEPADKITMKLIPKCIQE